MASTKFDSPKEAVAKFVIETGNAAKEHQILSVRTSREGHNNNKPRNTIKWNNGRNFNDNNGNFRQNTGRPSFNNGRPNQTQWRSNNPHNRNSNNNNFNRNYSNNHNGPNYQANRNNGNGNNRNVRAFGQENSHAPQQTQLGAQQTVQQSQNQLNPFMQSQF